MTANSIPSGRSRHAEQPPAREGDEPGLRCAVATCTTVDLSGVYTHSRHDPSPWEEKTVWGIARLPGGAQRFWGVPFSVGSERADGVGLIVIGVGSGEPGA